MPTELEELVDFISHGNTQVRQTGEAVENLVPYSLSQPAIFKTNQLLPVKDLKLLVRDYKKIAKDAITILINLSTDREVLEYLAKDDEFLKTLVTRVANPTEPHANLLSMLLANLTKHDSLTTLLTTTYLTPPELTPTTPTTLGISLLLDLFVRGSTGTYNPSADYNYLSYVFADLAKHSEGRTYFLSQQTYDNIIPLSKLIVFTEHASPIRRKGVASTIKNVAFEIDSHSDLLSESEINILPYLLLPIMGNESYDEDEMLDFLPDLQLLPEDKKRDADPTVIQTHVETLMLLTTTRLGRDVLRDVKVYPIVRETHLQVEDEGVREVCERLVQVLMRDEEDEGSVGRESKGGMERLQRPANKDGRLPKPFGRAGFGGDGVGSWASQDVEEEGDGDDDEDDKIIEV